MRNTNTHRKSIYFAISKSLDSNKTDIRTQIFQICYLQDMFMETSIQLHIKQDVTFYTATSILLKQHHVSNSVLCGWCFSDTE